MAGRNELLVRIGTAVVYAFVVIGALLLGVYSTVVLMSAFAGVCSFEFFRMMRKDGKLPNDAIGIIGAASYPVAAFVGGPVGTAGITVILLVLILIWYVFYPRVRITDISLTLFGAIYTGFSLSMLVLIRQVDSGMTGALLCIAIFFSVWANDSFAYLFGSKFGRHKLAPKISPKKSWEGFFAGVAGSLFIWLLIPSVLDINLSYEWAVVGGLVCGVIAVLGDFAESRIKRGAGVKDSGDTLPGHGGFLDRCDSLIFVSITAFFILRLGGAL